MIEELKASMVMLTGVTRDALHTQLGLAIFFGVALLMRQKVHQAWPICVTVVAAVLSEAFDYARDVSRYGAWDRAGSMHDIINTVFWPLIICLMVRAGIVFRRP